MPRKIVAQVRKVLIGGILSLGLLLGVLPVLPAFAAPATVMTDPPFTAQAAESVNVRSGPSTAFGVISVLPADALFFWNFATIGTPVIVHD